MPAPNSIVSEVREALEMRLRTGSCVGAVWGVREIPPRGLLALPGAWELWAWRPHGEGFAGVPAVDRPPATLSSSALVSDMHVSSASGSGSCSTMRERRSGLYTLTSEAFCSIWSSCSAVSMSVEHFLTSCRVEIRSPGFRLRVKSKASA